MRVHTYMHIYTHTHIHTYIHRSVHALTTASHPKRRRSAAKLPLCLYLRINASTYIHAYIYTHIHTYIHTQICACVDYGQSPKEAEECRKVTIMFIRLLTMDCEPFDYSKAETVNIIQKCICEIYSVLGRYEGTVSRFQIDDKGTGI